MTITHKFLKALGISEDATEEIISAHRETVDSIKAERDELLTRANTVDTLTAERDKLRHELEEAQAHSGDADKVQAEFDAYRAQIETEKSNGAKLKLIRAALEKAGANPAAIDLMTNAIALDKVELNGDTLKDEDSVVNPIRENHAALFGTQIQKGAPDVNPMSGGKNAATALSLKDALHQKYDKK